MKDKLITAAELKIMHEKFKELHKIIARSDIPNTSTVLNLLSDVGSKLFN